MVTQRKGSFGTRGIDPETFVSWLRVSDPQLSPDGRRLVYVREPVSRTGEHPESQIWMVDLETGHERRFTYGAGEETAPRWSPDGGWLAFLSDRRQQGRHQLFRMPAYGGEARQLSDHAVKIRAPTWSPDGTTLAFLSEEEDREAGKEDGKEQQDPIVVDHAKPTSLYMLAVDASAAARRVDLGYGHVTDYCWDPKSGALAVVVTDSALTNAYRHPHDLLVRERGGRTRRLCRFPSEIAQPRWSPDGRRIAFLGRAGRVVVSDALHIVDVASGNVSLLTEGYEGSISGMEWLPDSRRLIFLALENVHGALNEIDVAKGGITSALSVRDQGHGSFGGSLSLAGDGLRVASTRSSSVEPPEVVVAEIGGDLRIVTKANAALQDQPFQPAEPRTWLSPDGLAVSGLFTRPPVRFGPPPWRAVVVIHGGPASAFTDRFSGSWHDWAQLLSSHGFAVFMPNPRGSTGRGAAFTDANIGDLGGKELEDTLSGIDDLVSAGMIDPKRLAIAGWSHGGYVTAWAVTQTNRFRAAVMGAGLCNLVSDQGTSDIPGFNLDYFYETYRDLYSDPAKLWDRSPLKYVDQVQTPTLVLHGENDDRVRASQGYEFYRSLRSLGVKTKMILYPRETHQIRERDHQLDLQRQILGWLAEV